MRDDPKPSRLDLGLYGRDTPVPRITGIEVGAALLSVLWIGAALILHRGEGADGGGGAQGLMNGLALVMPVALIWVAAGAARTARALREEAARLQASIDAMRAAYVDQQQRGSVEIKPALAEKLEELLQGQPSHPAAAPAVFSSQRSTALAPERPVAPPSGPELPQPALALSAPLDKEPISISDFITALNFPQNEHDKDGFRSLRRALEDRAAERLVRASQDVLTLLSQDGIYMDDLSPDRARPEVWRRFAQGERGRAIAALGGIHDRSSLTLAAGRMKKDPVFRDAVHHFLRHFDRTFMEFERNADDAEIVDLADTRTARAFMLLGRVAGTFD